MREIRWTDESEEHIWTRHRVTTVEVEQVVNGQDRAEETGRDTTKVFGQTDAGRYLAVLLVDAVEWARLRGHGSGHDAERAPHLPAEKREITLMDRKTMLELREHFDTTDQSDAIENGELITEAPDPDPMITTSLRLPKSLLDWVREQAAAEGVKPTALVRTWIEERHATPTDVVPEQVRRLIHDEVQAAVREALG